MDFKCIRYNYFLFILFYTWNHHHHIFTIFFPRFLAPKQQSIPAAQPRLPARPGQGGQGGHGRPGQGRAMAGGERPQTRQADCLSHCLAEQQEARVGWEQQSRGGRENKNITKCHIKINVLITILKYLHQVQKSANEEPRTRLSVMSQYL